MLICDKRRPARARGYQYQAPPRGPNKDSPPGLRPAPRAPWRGAARPRPPGLRPLVRLRAPGPCCPATQPEGFRHGCAGGGGGQPLAVVHARRPAPWRFSGFGGNFKGWAVPWHGGGFGGVPPCRATVGNPAQAVGGVQPLAAVPAVHGLGEVVHGRPGSGRSGRGCFSPRAAALATTCYA